MILRNILNKLENIFIHKDSAMVLTTVAKLIIDNTSAAKLKELNKADLLDGTLIISVGKDFIDNKEIRNIRENNKEELLYFKINIKGKGLIYASKAYYLYSFVSYLLEYHLEQEDDAFVNGKRFIPSFNWQRVSYDYFLTQEGRIQRNFNRAEYVRELARFGLSHIEVNGLAYPMSLETGPKGETYPMFYTYCPALDQFVYSDLNKGLYPDYYLSANLEYLKYNANLARKYGLVPGLLCFEPRSVPEEFFNSYPMLRGARVDHPFRSFKPRYNMTITHPLVRDHYAEMMQKLMNEVPELGFINIWTNDSGAGFEHTKSLYVGRNGGAYLIREWKDDDQIAKMAGENAIRFLNVLKDSASVVNPEFRVITRMESFYGEHDIIIDGLGDRLDVETASLVQRGWDMPYSHPIYPDKKDINAGTVYQQEFNKKENIVINLLDEKGAKSFYYFAAGPHWMFEPLMGIPYPVLTYKRLKMLSENGVKDLSIMGGTFLPEHVPFNVNFELIRLFQFEADCDIGEFLENYAIKHSGNEDYTNLLEAWQYTEEAIISFPNISSLYSCFGFTWYRLWARPFVPDYEALSQKEKDYYENFMCTTPHNPNNVDLSRDVLFKLVDQKKCSKDIDRINKNVLPVLDKAIKILEKTNAGLKNKADSTNIFFDQCIRIKALRCWFVTQKNVAAWIYGEYSYMNTGSQEKMKQYKKYIKDLILNEIDNSFYLLELFKTDVEFMSLTDQGETPLIYGDNINELVKRRIKLMEKHIDDDPFIDMDYIEKKAGELIR